MQSPEPGAGPLHILIVEDTLEDFILIQRELKLTGLTFSAKRIDAPEALSREFDRQPPHLVLCDHGNARLDSFSVLEAVRAWSTALPFIVVTDVMPETQMTTVFTRGADDVVFKDRLGDLRPAVRRALRLGEARQRLVAAEQERDRLRAELEAWRFGHPRLPTPLPICAGCKKVRDRHDEWIPLESYLRDHFNVRLNHGLCFECVPTNSDDVA